jgi:hypothetical protein
MHEVQFDSVCEHSLQGSLHLMHTPDSSKYSAKHSSKH